MMQKGNAVDSEATTEENQSQTKPDMNQMKGKFPGRPGGQSQSSTSYTDRLFVGVVIVVLEVVTFMLMKFQRRKSL